MSYEFTSQQNDLIGRLARKMSLVGLVSLVFGVFYLLAAALLVAFLFQDRLPDEVMQKIPEDVRAQVPRTTYLWAIIVQTALAGLIFTMIGVWTRSAASSFQEIVATTGRDVGHLMNALGALYKMYSLLHTLIVITILAFLITLGLQLYLRFKG